MQPCCYLRWMNQGSAILSASRALLLILAFLCTTGNGMQEDIIRVYDEKGYDARFVPATSIGDNLEKISHLLATSSWEHFYDPSGPYQNYGNNWDIRWDIQSRNSGCRVMVQFQYLRVEFGADSVNIYNGDNSTISTDPKAGPAYISSGNTIRIHLKTDNSVVHNGFRATYKQYCGFVEPVHHINPRTLPATNNWKQLHDGSGRWRDYDVNLDIFWVIRPISERCRAVVQFQIVDIFKGDQDNLTLYLGDMSEVTNTDTNLFNPIVGKIYRANPSSSEIVIHFNSDKFNVRHGFSLFYKQDCGRDPYWSYSRLLSGTQEWVQLTDPLETIPHSYGAYYSWLIFPADPRCYIKIQFSTAQPEHLEIKFCDGGDGCRQFIKNASKYSSHRKAGDIEVSYKLDSDHSSPVRVFTGRYKEICPSDDTVIQ